MCKGSRHYATLSIVLVGVGLLRTAVPGLDILGADGVEDDNLLSEELVGILLSCNILT